MSTQSESITFDALSAAIAELSTAAFNHGIEVARNDPGTEWRDRHRAANNNVGRLWIALAMEADQ